ncbi:MAG TPA: hypothetical protein VFA28_02805 [Bryobacteraceae bacterium]|nr:hypothetical protein [Bryobacteraceae bacterium]
MTSVRNIALALTAVAVTASAQVDPTLLGLVMPDAKVISGIRVDSAKGSQFGQYVLAHMQSDDAGLQTFISNTGFDPRRDLNEILVATSGTSDAPSPLILGKGVFNPSQILTAARNQGATPSSYKGFDLLSRQGTKSTDTIALNASFALIGPADQVRAAIDRLGAQPALDPAVIAKVQTTAAANDAWFVSTGPITNFFTGKLSDSALGPAMQGNLFQAIQQASGGLKFGQSGGVLITGEAVTRSPQDATALADVIRFIAGLIQMNAGADPQAQQAAAVLKDLQVTPVGSTTKLSLSLSEAFLEQMFLSGANKSAKRARGRRAALDR